VNDRQVLLTGGTGFLGSHVAELLSERGYSVRATVRKSSDTRWIEHLPLDLVEVDLSDPSDLGAALSGVGSVVHVGGLTRASDPSIFHRVNAEGTGHLAVAAARAGVERFVYVSSLAARGPDGASGPTSEYGRSKLGGELRLAELAAAGEAPSIIRILRPGGIYGPRDSDLLSIFRMARRGLVVVPASDVRLQPVHVRDVTTSVLCALETTSSEDPGPLPVMGSEILGWTDVARAIGDAQERGARVMRLPGSAFMAFGLAGEFAARFSSGPPIFDRRRAADLTRVTWTADTTATERALGWAAGTSLAEGMAETTAWYIEQGWI
jgi:dihydroflavonol-4-reductase